MEDYTCTSTSACTDEEENTSSQNPLIVKLCILLSQEGSEDNNESPAVQVPVAFESERRLVAWVLLTRFSHDDLDHAWTKYSKVLEGFAKELLSLPPTTNCKDLYIRLIAQVTSRLSAYPHDIGESLFHAWDESMELAVHMDVCASLDVWMESDPATASELRILERIWKVYLQSTASASDEATNATISEDTGDNDGNGNGNHNDTAAFEFKLMSQTLSSILTDSHEQKDYYSTKSWHELILALFQSHGHQLLPDSLIPIMLSTPLPPPSVNANHHVTSAWHEWILSVIQTRVTTTPSFGHTCLKDPKAINNLNQLLLAHVVAPTNDSLRGMAWQTLTAMGETCGWRWILLGERSSSALGAGTTLCTWVRLASGELNIQLQQLLSASPAAAANFMQASLVLPISHSCARVLMSVVQFCVQLEEEPHRMPISSDSLLHLRQSLEQSLWTLVEYLQHHQREQNLDMNQPSDPFATIAIRLFGTLLMEVDIWDLLRKEESPQEVLSALIRTMPMEKKDTTSYSLLPGLVNIIGDAESNPEKQEQLSSIWNPLFEYLYSYWQDYKQTMDDSIAWACSCTELWSEHETSDSVKKRRLTVLLIDWMQTVLQRVSSLPVVPQVQSYLSLVLGCYMTLCKDREQPPRQHESRVIVRALQLCEHA
jgi:hypothetical protein